MATLILGAAGTAIGGMFGGAILGLSGSVIGGMIGSTIGSAVDSWLISSLAPGQRIEGARLDSLRITSSTEGAVIPRLYGRMRMGGNIIWATDFREVVSTTTQKGGGKGGGPKIKTTEYLYFASFAVALCEGPITGIGRIWADGKPLDLTDVVWRWYPGDESQEADPFIAAKMGASSTPAYRGTAYVMFEDLPLNDYGSRLPQLTFEVFSPLADDESAEGLTRAVTIIPAAGEFAYATQPISKMTGGFMRDILLGPGLPITIGGTTSTENVNAVADTADMVVSLDRLQSMAPKIESASLVVSWFGSDLRAGACQIEPKVEFDEKATSPAQWSVNGIPRDQAAIVSLDAQSRPVYGGTPADFSVVQAIQEMKARGLRVTFYPFLMMDIPEGNTLPDPYSDNTASIGQSALPWRGRITCAPAAGFVGSVDKTASAAAQVAAFFGTATPAQFAVSGETVSWTGPANEWGLRRMILHYAHLCAAAGGVDAFLIGTEMRGLTQIRDSATSYPAVQEFRELATDVRAILGMHTKISYAADWSEYFGHQPADGSGDVLFHLDPLWADPDIDFIGIDNYMPLSDWRDGFDHLDAQAGWPAIHDRAYLQSNVAGGEGYDWFYASISDRAAQNRTLISDGAYAKPWVFRYKDLRAWWSNAHYNRPDGAEQATPTGWQPQSKPIWFTELGCPAVDRGTNQPNVFFDPKSSESFLPYFSRGWRDDAIQRAYLEATFLHWQNSANNPVSAVYGAPMVVLEECAVWTWDARPYPFFPGLEDVWVDGQNWRLGHWLTGRLGAVSLAALVRSLCLRAGLPPDRIDVSGLWGAVEGYVINAFESPRASITTLARHFGFDAVETSGVIAFCMRGRASGTVLRLKDMVIGEDISGEVIELTRGQETELPQALKWQFARADEDYDSAVVEAQRITVDATRIGFVAYPMAVAPEEAERRCRRALIEAWVGRESASFRLPPSRLALDPTDVIALEHDGRVLEYRLGSIADAGARLIEAIRQDRAVYDLPPGAPRPASISTPSVFGKPDFLFLDLPQLLEDQPAHRPFVAAFAQPWPGEMAVYGSPGSDGFGLLTTIPVRARMGVLAEPLGAGHAALWDRGNALTLDLFTGALESVTDLALFAGANALAVESAPDVWEILQAGQAELIGPSRYRLTRLLRGQRGTGWAMGDPAPAGVRVIVLDAALNSLPVAQDFLGLPQTLLIGPAQHSFDSESYTASTVTPQGRGLVPFAPAHARLSRQGNGDLVLGWTRQDRALNAAAFDLPQTPMSEAELRFLVEVLDGETVLRSFETTEPEWLYPVAGQIADWGSAVTAFRCRIAQLGALGWGDPLDTITSVGRTDE